MAERALRDLPFFFLIVISIFLGCAQRDNLFDPSSPGYVGTLSGIYVSNGYDKNFVLLNYGDSNFVVRPGTKFFFKATVLDSVTGDPLNLKVRLRVSQIVEGGSSPYTYENDDFTSDSVLIGDTGRVVAVFTTGDQINVFSERKYFFTIKQNRKPMISMFAPAVKEANIVWVGKQQTVDFRTEIYDPDSLLDSISYALVYIDTLNKDNALPDTILYDSIKVQKRITDWSPIYIDTVSFRCFSNKPGICHVFLNAYDKEKRLDSSSTLVYFNPVDLSRRPVIDSIAYEKIGKDSFFVNFKPYVTVYNGDLSNASYIYDFGDGVNLTTNYSNIPHEFKKPGSYTVLLIVMDEGGGSDTASVNVEIVEPPKPVKILDLISKPDSGQAPLNVNFEVILPADVNPKDIKEVKFKFGDGGSSNGSMKKKYTYTNPGKYVVKAIVESNTTIDTAYDTIRVYPKYIHYSPKWTLQAGDTARFWLENYTPVNKSVRWTVSDTVAVLKPDDTLAVFIKPTFFPIEVRVEELPEGSSVNYPWTYPMESFFIKVASNQQN